MLFNVNSLNSNEKFALLYGIMLGDGCLSLVNGNKKFISITCSLDDDLPFFQEVLAPLLEEFRGKRTKIKFRKDCRAIEFNFTDLILFDKISASGFPIGKKGNSVKIPSIFYEKNLLKNIVQGFFATDGSLVLTKNPNKLYPRVEGNGISRELITQISNYLQSKGMHGKVYDAKRKKFYKKYQNQYRFQFNGKDNLLIFNNQIGFVNPKHQLRFQNFMEYDRNYVTK